MKKWAVLAAFLAFPAYAEPGPTVNWLMTTPTTLFDRGMDSVRADLNSTTRYLTLPDGARNFSAWASYDYEKNEINMTVSVFGLATGLSNKACADLKKQTESLTYFSISEKKEDIAKSIADYLNRHFSHVGYQEKNRPDDIGKNLAPIVFLQVSSYNPAKKESLTCRGRLGEDPSFQVIPIK